MGTSTPPHGGERGGDTPIGAIDYRLSDPYLDPPGLFEACSAEEIVRLPHSFWCYAGLAHETPVGELPASASGVVTFGCLNTFCKLNHGMLKLWAKILGEAPGSRLMLLLFAGSHKQDAIDFMAAEGIAADRLEFSPRLPRKQYLELYERIDIGLDTLPYNGHTTSLDALWMGVPVVTLVGRTVVGRAGLSQLTNLGLTELIAHEPDEFVRIAVELAKDTGRLAEMRRTLRDRMKDSPLMDDYGFAKGIEGAYRTAWQRWCEKGD